MMIGPYVPLLKGKTGEFDAIRRIPLSKKATFTPLIDIPQLSVESGEEAPASLDDFLQKKVTRLAKAWACEDRPVIVDLFDTDPMARTSDGSHPLVRTFDFLRNAGVPAIPTTGLDRDDAYQVAVREVVRIDNRGVCLRMLREDLALGFDLSSTLGDLLGRLGLDRGRSDLLLDFRKLEAEAADDVSATVAKTVNGLAGVTEWRSLIFAGSNMPQSLAKDVDRDSIGDVERVEFRVWRDIVARRLKRTPLFGDYGVVHPDLTYPERKIINASATIRYTLPDRWLIVRGRSLSQSPEEYRQFYALSRTLVNRKEFMGSRYSWGDEQIQNRAERRGGTGNLTTWVAVATNHHVTFVAGQVTEAAV